MIPAINDAKIKKILWAPGKRDEEWVQAAIKYLQNSPKVFNRKEIGYYYYVHYYAISAMVLAGEEHYAKWYPQIRDALITLQQGNGSWQNPEKPYPHSTPMAIIILLSLIHI